MKAPLVHGADIKGRRATIRLDGGIRIPLTFGKAVRRVTIYSGGKRMLVETVDGRITRYTAEQLVNGAKATA